MPDSRFGTHVTGLDGPADYHFAITPGASEFAQIPRAIYCEAAGTATIEDANGVALVYTLVAGQLLPFRARRVTAATATLRGWF